MRQHAMEVKALKDYQQIDHHGRDNGANIRHRAEVAGFFIKLALPGYAS